MAHTTRAYMSGVHEHSLYERCSRTEAINGYRSDHVRASLAEASRILADVEPRAYGRIGVSTLTYTGRTVDGFDAVPGITGEMFGALGQSMAAFVNDVGRA